MTDIKRSQASKHEANAAPMNPWSKQHWNLTGQVKIFKRDRAEANRLAQAAGHKDALAK